CDFGANHPTSRERQLDAARKERMDSGTVARLHGVLTECANRSFTVALELLMNPCDTSVHAQVRDHEAHRKAATHVDACPQLALRDGQRLAIETVHAPCHVDSELPRALLATQLRHGSEHRRAAAD